MFMFQTIPCFIVIRYDKRIVNLTTAVHVEIERLLVNTNRMFSKRNN